MRVLFLESSPVWVHTLPRGFEDLGHEVNMSGPLTEQSIPQRIADFRPDLIVSMGWGPEQSGAKPDWIREQVKPTGIPYVYWATEDPNFTYHFSLPLVRRMQPDFVFTICARKVQSYVRRGFRAAHLDFAFHPSVHRPTHARSRYRTRIAVVANAYPHVLERYPHHFRRKSIQTLVAPLVQRGIRIDFYGRDWDKMEHILGAPIPLQWLHDYVPYTEAYKVYNSADIIIGPQNYRDMVTMRTYEILGSGGFLLTSDTRGVRHLVTPGKDLIVSSSARDTLRFVEHYLARDQYRRRIRHHGRHDIRHETYRHRAETMIRVLQAEHLIDTCRSAGCDVPICSAKAEGWRDA